MNRSSWREFFSLFSVFLSGFVGAGLRGFDFFFICFIFVFLKRKALWIFLVSLLRRFFVCNLTHRNIPSLLSANCLAMSSRNASSFFGNLSFTVLLENKTMSDWTSSLDELHSKTVCATAIFISGDISDLMSTTLRLITRIRVVVPSTDFLSFSRKSCRMFFSPILQSLVSIWVHSSSPSNTKIEFGTTRTIESNNSQICDDDAEGISSTHDFS